MRPVLLGWMYSHTDQEFRKTGEFIHTGPSPGCIGAPLLGFCLLVFSCGPVANKQGPWQKCWNGVCGQFRTLESKWVWAFQTWFFSHDNAVCHLNPSLLEVTQPPWMAFGSHCRWNIPSVQYNHIIQKLLTLLSTMYINLWKVEGLHVSESWYQGQKKGSLVFGLGKLPNDKRLWFWAFWCHVGWHGCAQGLRGRQCVDLSVPWVLVIAIVKGPH